MIMASTTIQSIYRRPIPRVSVFPLGINNRMVNPNSYGISQVLHI